MADIDIEEHDVLDNPVIKSIFPDISVVKKEISQYYEDGSNLKQESKSTKTDTTFASDEFESNTQGLQKSAPKCIPMIIRDKSNVDETQSHVKATFLSNKIIIGSKPNSIKETKADINKPRVVVRLPRVVLQDIGSYILYRNNSYCEDCLTLFPSRSDFDEHRRKIHTKISSSIQVNRLMKIKQKVHKCTVCDSCFSSSGNLRRHYKNIHCKKELLTKHKCSLCIKSFSMSSNLLRHYKDTHQKRVDFKSKYNHKRLSSAILYDHRAHISSRVVAPLNVITRSHNKSDCKNNTSNANNLCFHCKKSFPDQKSLIDHIYKELEPKRHPKITIHEKVTQPTKTLVTIIDQLKKESSILKMTTPDQDLEPYSSQTLSDKLMFENEEFHDNFPDVLETTGKRNYQDSKEIKNLPKISQTVSTATTSERKHKVLTSDEHQGLDLSKIDYKLNLRSKRKNAHQAEDPIQHQMKKKRPKNELDIHGQICLPTYQNKENNHLQASGSQHLNTEETVNKLDLHRHTSKTFKEKQTGDVNKQLSSNSDNETNEDNEINTENAKDNFIYECVHCSYMVPTVTAYYMHMCDKHNIEIVSRVNRVKFDERCKYCSSKSNSEKAHNKHLHKCHYDLMHKKINCEVMPKVDEENKKKTITNNPSFKKYESFVLKSIIYKCNRCDIHFLSSYIAKDHEKHNMELLVNWKCSICRRIFKKHDKYLHLEQHTFSKSLNVCEFNESELSTLMYNCTKCAIHFTEGRYLEHYSKCELKSTDSVYCENCDILIDKCGYRSHELYHKKGKNASEFTVIVADIIMTSERKNSVYNKKRKRHYEQVICLTFCQTCNCYLSDMELTRKTHEESRCFKISKYVCNLCGLVFTGTALRTHRQQHNINLNLKLHDFKFFDLKGTQINPPLPKYPRCNICEVHFLNMNDLNVHLCSEIEYLTCSDCNIKLSESAFKLHMNFHNCAKHNTKINNNTFQKTVTSDSQKKGIEPDKLKIATSGSDAVIDRQCSDTVVNSVDDNPNNTLYCCQPCKISVDSYDKVVDHCQKHYSPSSKLCSTLHIMCSKCSLQFETESYTNHLTLHLRNVNIELLIFDPTYFTADNNTWLRHVFAYVPQAVQNRAVNESIYQHECRIKMDVVQKGPSHLTVYKCDKCGNFIDPDCLLLHVKDPCFKVRKYPCSACGLPFMSHTFRIKHEKIHRRYNNLRIKSYNIVLINCEAHNKYNIDVFRAIEQYIVLYQCRNCDGVVDKLQRNVHQCRFNDLRKCSTCKLLLYKEDFNIHISYHKNLPRFKTEYMKIVLFGSADDVNEKKVISASFSGMVCDYILYKCAKCEICLKSQNTKLRHVCNINDSKKWKCPKCDLYMCASHTLKNHMQMHDRDSEYIIENIKIIAFDILSDNNNFTHKGKDFDSSNNNNAKKLYQKLNVGCDENEPTTKNSEKESHSDRVAVIPNVISVISEVKETVVKETLVKESVNLFKCGCGLHFVDKFNMRTHMRRCNPKIKIIRQNCSKCGLLFNPKELFSHLITHHGDKNKTYRFEILEMSAEKTID